MVQENKREGKSRRINVKMEGTTSRGREAGVFRDERLDTGRRGGRRT